MINFQGHIVWPHGLLGDVFLSLLPVAAFCFLKRNSLLPRFEKVVNLWDILLTIVNLVFLPNSVYAVFEIKHLLFVDAVADSPNALSYLVFGGVSLIGLISALTMFHLVINHYANSKLGQNFLILVLGVVNGFGVSAGLLDLNSWDLITDPKKTMRVTHEIFTSPHSFTVFIFTALIYILIAKVAIFISRSKIAFCYRISAT